MARQGKAKDWDLTPAGGRRYSKYPTGDITLVVPSSIEGFMAQELGETSITLYWMPSPAAEEVTSYNLVRGKTDPNNPSAIHPDELLREVTHFTNIPPPPWTNTGLLENTGYYYRVAAVNAAGAGPNTSRLFTGTLGVEEPPQPPPDDPNIVPASLIVEQNFANMTVADYFGQRGLSFGEGKGQFLFENYSQTGCAIVSSPVYEGNRSARVLLTANATGPELYMSEGGVADLGGSTRYRAEINFNQAIQNSGYRNGNFWGLTLWFGFAFRLGADWHVGCKAGGVVHQVINRGWAPPYTACNPVEGIYATREGDGFTAARRYFDVYPFQLDPPQTGTVGRKSKSYSTPITATQAKNGWVRIVHRVRFHPYGEGAWKLWVNDVLAFEDTGITTYPDDPEFLGFKVGLYQSGRAGDANWHTAVPHDSHVFVSSVRVADEALGGNYATVDPKSYI